MIGRLWLLAAAAMWPTAAFAQGADANYTDGGHMDRYGHMMGPWGGGVFMWLLLLAVVVVLVYFLLTSRRPGGSGATPHETALDILKKRYARGEITKEQFDEMKKDL